MSGSHKELDLMDVDERIQAWIKQCEGLKLEAYVDTRGHLTVGWGRNLENGISQDEAEFMFQNDLARCVKELEQYAWYQIQPQHIKNALINMNFNLGITKLTEFTHMISALINKDYTTASYAALNSNWAKEVGQRAKDIALMIRQG